MADRSRKEELDSYDFKRKEKRFELGLQNFECDQQKQWVEKILCQLRKKLGPEEFLFRSNY